MKSFPTKNTLLQAATSQPTKQSLQESIFSITQEKLKNKKFPTLKKNKTSFQRTVQTLTDNALNVNRIRQSGCKPDTSTLRTDRRASGNSTYPKGGDSCSKDSFVVNGTFVFQIKFCGKSPALRVAAKR
jgi:hypothetical protein